MIYLPIREKRVIHCKRVSSWRARCKCEFPNEKRIVLFLFFGVHTHTRENEKKLFRIRSTGILFKL